MADIIYNEIDAVRWVYNCYDVMYTKEIDYVETGLIAQEDKELQEFYKFQMYQVAPALVDIMNKGVRVDLAKKEELHTELSKLLVQVENMVNSLLGFEINLKSSPQVKRLFTDFLGVKAIKDKKTKSETFGSEAMFIYLEQYPILHPLITLILEYRTISIFVRTFLSAQVDEDNRMRTSYNVAGTKSYRLSSRKNAFGKGMNLANVPSKGKINLKYALMPFETEVEAEDVPEDYIDIGEVHEGITKLPNCKELFLPDPGYTFFNIDYSGADAMVVAWDSDCQWLKKFFRTSTEKLYIYIAREYLQREVSTSDSFYKKIKQFVHLTNYGGMEEKAAASSGLPIETARNLRNWYFKKCPEIPDWHKRIKSEVYDKGYIRNIFGAKFWLLDRKSPTLMNQAYALIPQSTIAILVNKGLCNIHYKEPNIDVLMQIHDAVAGQFLTADTEAPRRIEEHMKIALPYKEPLIIPADISYSAISYGHC